MDNKPYDSQFDLNADGTVSAEDRRVWVEDIKGTLFGDANLDTNVNAGDLNAMALNWQETNRTWSGGDFDGSGFVDSSDLNLIGLSWQVATAVASPVPEPSAAGVVWMLFAVALIRRGVYSS